MRETAWTPHLVLIHGAGHGAWCWFKIRCLLESSGFKVTCLDLTSAGIDATDPNTVLTFQHYNQPLIDFLSALPESEKVILVGHSAGGVCVTDAMYKCPEKIQFVVYLAAPMLKHGFVTEQDFKDGIPDLSEYGDISEYGYGLGPDQPPTSVKIKEEFQREILYFMSPLEDSTLASMLLKPEPTMPGGGAQFTGENADRVPRVYIKTVLDRSLKDEQQEAMIQRWPPAQVFAIESDHSPFFSAPLILSGFLIQIAASF